ncbi:hypothetical protein [Marinagarivorans algicola]|uniref:hypothetical protein n=1 Tax=Marinagarivorans algicola TaxID=1513270 RepID=UPI0006B91BF7|nr:hypothetical protein [Marinagarivorans algicola]
MKTTLKKQQGIATIVIVLLVGVALTASTLGIVHSVKATQHKQISSHTVTNAQGAAWMLAEATRLYLVGKDTATLHSKIAQPLPYTLPNEYAHLRSSSITINQVNDPSSTGVGIDIDVSIVAIDTASQATSILDLTYNTRPPVPGSCPATEALALRGDLTNESIDSYLSGTNTSLFVDGSIGNPSAASSIHGVTNIKATGDIHLQGTGNNDIIDIVKANGDVRISASARIINIQAGKDVIIEDYTNPHIDYILAMRDISYGSSATVKKLQAHNDVTINNGNVEEIIAGNDTLITRYNTFVNTVYSYNNIDFKRDLKSDKATAVNAITCGQNGRVFSLLVAGQEINNCNNANNAQNIGNGPAVKASLPAIDTYTPVDVPPSLIADADQYLPDTNYAFTYDATSQKIKVKVKKVHGIADGDYILFTGKPDDGNEINLNTLHAEGAAPSKNDPTLCNSFGRDANSACIKFLPNLRITTDTDQQFILRLANGGELTANPNSVPDDQRTVLAKDAPDGIWVITTNAIGLPPGVLYFDRDLRIRAGASSRFINSFLAAGDTQVTGAMALVAPVHAPVEALCGNENYTLDIIQTGDKIDGAIRTTGGARFKTTDGAPYPYPTAYCQSATQATATPKKDLPFPGHFAFMIGQQNDADTPKPTYQGGDFYVQSTLDIFGRIVAGNTVNLIQGANFQLLGNMSSEARRETKVVAQNYLQGKIRINDEHVTNNGGNDPQACNSQRASTSVLWSRYL